MVEPEQFLDGRIRLFSGDCLDVLKTLAPNSVDSIVTDPPYGLSFMGKGWDHGVPGIDYWKLAFRVLKPGGHLVAFSGTRTSHRMVSAIEDAGFEIRDSIAWLYGSGFPKSLDVSKAIDKAAGAEREVIRERYTVKRIKPGATVVAEGEWGKQEIPYTATDSAPSTDAAKQWSGFGTALKPALEPICLARKPLIGTVAENVLKHGTGALNIDGCRVPSGDVAIAREGEDSQERRYIENGATNFAAKPGSRRQGGRRPSTHEGYQRSGATMFQDKTDWELPSNGRWPANVIHDGSDEVVSAFPETTSGVLKAGTIRNHENQVYGKGMSAAGIPATLYDTGGDSGSAARFFYTAKADADDRLGSKHPTVKPLDLMQWLVRLVTPKGGLVLDPFAGTGTTGEAAWREGFRAVLIERETEYQSDIRRRMALCLAGPEERKRESIKAKMKGKPDDHGPLFGSPDTPPAGKNMPDTRASSTSAQRTNNRPGGIEVVNP